MLERCFEIAKANLKHNLFPHCVIAVFLCAVTPLIMGVENLEELQVAKMIEFYLGFLGVILLIPLFLPDTNKDIRDLTASKKTPITGVHLIRLSEAVVCLALILSVYLYALKLNNCSFRYGACLYAAMANCIFMGGIGLLFYSFIDNIALAYMMPFLYFNLSMGSGKKYLGKFWLFALSAEEDIADKGYLLAAGLIMIAAALMIRKGRRE